MSECVCGADDPCDTRCERHDLDLHGYPCGDCHREWQEDNPATHLAISRFAGGKGSLAAIRAARHADQEASK